MRILLCLLGILMFSSSFGQKEAANWYFGKNAGLDFNTGRPRPLLDGQINTIEGCEAFSDGNGNLLFYTEGKTVWNKEHKVMPNGTDLKGSFSTSQAALVVPNPLNKNIFYVFTPDDALAENFNITNGFNYSVIDMSKDNGLGDVTEKNFELLPQTSEKVSAVKNAKENYYWVVTHFGNKFYSYKVDGSGVDATPTISTTGPMITDFANIRGNMKLSPDGTKLAIAHTIVKPGYASSFYLFDFDIDTGVVSNARMVNDKRLYYGVEFSSNSSKLYASGIDLEQRNDSTFLGGLKLVQFNLDEPLGNTNEFIMHSFANRSNVFVAGALQIGIDKKIYHSMPSTNLSVIRTPNLNGLDADFRPFAVDLGGQFATFGLPPFIQSFFETIVTINNFCEGQKTTFTTDSTGLIDSITWHFGDPDSGTANFSSELNPAHIFSSSGIFKVTIDVEYINGASRRFIEFVEIAETPKVNTEVELIQCDIDGQNDGITRFNLMQSIPLFNNGNEDMTGLFFASEANAIDNVNQIDPIGYTNAFDGQVIYARAFVNSECFEIVKVALKAEPLTDLGDYDTLFICNGITGTLATIVNIADVHQILAEDFKDYDDVTIYLEQGQAVLELDAMPLENHTFGPFDPLEVYFRIEAGEGCAFIGKAFLDVSEPPEYEENIAMTLCQGEALLTAPNGYENYLWPNGSTSQNYVTDVLGEVDVVFGNGACNYIQTFEILPEPTIFVDEIIIEDFRRNNCVTVVLGYSDDETTTVYSMDGGLNFQTSNRFENILPGIYELVIDDGCSLYESDVLVGGTPSFFTPNNDGIHDIWTIENANAFPNYMVSIFDRYGKLIKNFNENQIGWDGTFQNANMPADDYWYRLELPDGREVTGYFALKR
ncbi:MAG: T9SS type B sorting domain-containing protein [Croceitalea sp.]|nr:T9SS type B sorting domain-containing protein [Croceitalea sp.]NNL08946.1 T9SS type B sorting domain-containing protein [Croceitalea sp.]